MDYVKIRTIVTDHERFALAGEEACALWFWSMTYAGRQETDGLITTGALLTYPWCARTAVVRRAYKLVEVGLWEAVEGGYRILRWAEQGNMTRAQLDGERSAARARMKRRRSSPPPPMFGECSGEHQANFGRSSANVPTSTSLISGSVSLSETEIETSKSSMGPPPDWFRDVVERVQSDTGERFSAAEAWLRYSGHRAGKGMPTNPRDASYWLGTVMVPEARRERKRDSSVVRKVAPVEPPPMSADEHRRFAEELSRRVVRPMFAGGAT